MNTSLIKQISFISLMLLAFSASHASNCGSKGQKGCPAAVVTPDILIGTSQAIPAQPTAPIPTANQLTPQLIPQEIPQPIPQAVPQMVPQPIPQEIPQPVPQAVPQLQAQPVPQTSPQPIAQQQMQQQLVQQQSVAAAPIPSTAAVYFEKRANGVTRQLPDTDVAYLRNIGYISPDGTLTQHAIDNGFSMQGSIAPVVIAPPQPQAPKVPNLRPADPVPTAQTPVIYFETHNGVTTQLTDKQVRQLIQAGTVLPDGSVKPAARQVITAVPQSTPTLAPVQPQVVMVPNLKPPVAVPPQVQPTLYFETHRGVTTQLTDSQVKRLMSAGTILPDGSIKPSANNLITAVAQVVPPLAPVQPMKVPNLRPADPVPTAQTPVVYFETHNGVTTRLTDTQVIQLIRAGTILPDGSIKPMAKQVISGVAQSTPNRLPPEPMKVPNLRPADPVPTPHASIQYFMTNNGVTKPLTPDQLRRLNNLNRILPDGTLTPAAQAQGFTAVVQATPVIPTVPILAPNQTPQQVPDATPSLVPNKVPQLVATPNQVPQLVPDATPAITPQRVPQLVVAPNQVPQQVPGATPLLVPPLAAQEPKLMNAPNLAQPMVAPTTGSPTFYFVTNKGVTKVLTPDQLKRLRSSGLVNPDGTLTASALAQGFTAVVQGTPSIASIVVSSTVPVVAVDAVKQDTVNTATAIEVTDKANSAFSNLNMITNTPGRQSPDSYALFANSATGSYRECVVSGLERRKVIQPDGSDTYVGSLPGFRTVSNEVADIPSWHPNEAGCIISLQHKASR